MLRWQSSLFWCATFASSAISRASREEKVGGGGDRERSGERERGIMKHCWRSPAETLC
jgi:hypothetical protein